MIETLFPFEKSAENSKKIIAILETIPGTEAHKYAPEEIKRRRLCDGCGCPLPEHSRSNYCGSECTTNPSSQFDDPGY